MAIATDVQAINERVIAEGAFVDRLLSEVSKVIVGQHTSPSSTPQNSGMDS